MMTANPSLLWRLGVAGISLLAAIVVYTLVRLNPPELLEPFQVDSALRGAQPGVFGSAPSLFYTLSIGVLIGVWASSRSSARLHCLLWTLVASCLELSQATMIAVPVADWLNGTLSVSAWNLVGPYFTRGVFDWFDLLATLAGGVIALMVLHYLPTETKDEADL
jgi:hypothetical protein